MPCSESANPSVRAYTGQPDWRIAMSRKVLLAGLLGGVTMFVWNAIAHMALPLGEAGIRQVENDEPMLAAMRASIPDHGIYMFPRMPPGMTEAQYGEKIASGPSGLMVYFPRREFSFGASMENSRRSE